MSTIIYKPNLREDEQTFMEYWEIFKEKQQEVRKLQSSGAGKAAIEKVIGEVALVELEVDEFLQFTSMMELFSFFFDKLSNRFNN